MILKSSENQLSRTSKSNLIQTFRSIFPFQFLRGSYFELQCSKRYINEGIQFLIDTFTENGHEKKTLVKSELQNPPGTNKDNTEDIKKVVNLPWIPIIGLKLRQAFK